MKKYQKLYQLKQIVKAYAEFHKYARLTRKVNSPVEFQKKYEELGVIWRDIIKDTPINKYIDGRILHIAYSLLKGKSYQQIEKGVRYGNNLDVYKWKEIIKIMEFFKDEENTVKIPTEYSYPNTVVNPLKVKKVKETSNE